MIVGVPLTYVIREDVVPFFDPDAPYDGAIIQGCLMSGPAFKIDAHTLYQQITFGQILIAIPHPCLVLSSESHLGILTQPPWTACTDRTLLRTTFLYFLYKCLPSVKNFQ